MQYIALTVSRVIATFICLWYVSKANVPYFRISLFFIVGTEVFPSVGAMELIYRALSDFCLGRENPACEAYSS